MPWMMLPVAVSSVTAHDAMSPVPTKTGSLAGVVWKVQVGPVVVWVPSLTVAYHSNVWPGAEARPGRRVVAARGDARVLGDLGEVAARERTAEVGDGQRIGVGVGDADVQRRR